MESDLHLPFRGVPLGQDHSQQAFFIESFIDEAAHAAARDPLEFRPLCWASRRATRRCWKRLPPWLGWGKLLAAGHGRAWLGRCRHDRRRSGRSGHDQGQAAPDQRLRAADPGFAMNPDGFRNQMLKAESSSG